MIRTTREMFPKCNNLECHHCRFGEISKLMHLCCTPLHVSVIIIVVAGMMVEEVVLMAMFVSKLHQLA